MIASPTRTTLRHALRACALLAVASTLTAQTAAVDPSTRLREVLPPDVAERVIAHIAAARARELPAQALENRALKFAARGITPVEVERAVNDHAVRLERSAKALDVRPVRPSGTEIEAGAEALRQGVDGAAVSALASSAPSGRSLAVPLFVIGSLVERGLPSDEALARVRERLIARASDAELERIPHTMRGGTPGAAAPGRGGVRGPVTGDRPAEVPANGGARRPPTRPTPPAPGSKRP